MSTEVAPTQDAFVADEDIVDAIEQGGSPDGAEVQAGASGGDAAAAKGEEPDASGASEGAEPEAKEDGGVSPTSWQEEKKALETQLAEAQQLFADIRAVAKVNPEVAKAFGLGGEGASATNGWRAEAEQAIRDGLKPEAGGDVMMKALKPVFDQIEAALRDIGTVKPTVGRLAQNTAQTQFRNGLIEAKVPVDNPAFQKVLKQLRQDPEFQSLESRGSALAIRTAANEWFAKTGRAAANGDARVGLAAAKAGKVGPRTNGAGLAEQIVKLSGPYDPMKSYKLRMDAQKAGRPAPKIIWGDEEK